MMNCEECKDKLSFIVYGEQFAEEMIVLEHIGDCDSCRDEFMNLLEVKEVLDSSIGGGSLEMTLGKRITEEVLNEAADLDDQKKRDFHSSTFQQFPVLLSTLAACIAIAFIWYKKEGSMNESQHSSTVVAQEKSIEIFENESSETLNDEKEKSDYRKTRVKSEVSKDDIQTDSLSEVQNEVSFENEKVVQTERFQRVTDREMKQLSAPELLNASAKKKSIRAKVNEESDKGLSVEIVGGARGGGAPAPANAKAKEDVLGSADRLEEKALFDASKNANSLTPQLMIQQWLTKNQDEKEIGEVFDFLKNYGFDNLSVEEVKVEENSAYKVILQKKNEKAVDYGYFFFHNEEVVRFRPMAEVKEK